jgi:hypothetical protein
MTPASSRWSEFANALSLLARPVLTGVFGARIEASNSARHDLVDLFTIANRQLGRLTTRSTSGSS